MHGTRHKTLSTPAAHAPQVNSRHSSKRTSFDTFHHIFSSFRGLAQRSNRECASRSHPTAGLRCDDIARGNCSLLPPHSRDSERAASSSEAEPWDDNLRISRPIRQTKRAAGSIECSPSYGRPGASAGGQPDMPPPRCRTPRCRKALERESRAQRRGSWDYPWLAQGIARCRHGGALHACVRRQRAKPVPTDSRAPAPLRW